MFTPYDADGYIYSYDLMDDEALEFKSFYSEARIKDTPVLMAGFQRLIRTLYLSDLIIGPEDEEFFKKYGAPINVDGFNALSTMEDSLPLHIQVLKEGTVTKTGIPLLQITNTHPAYSWLPGMFEDYLLNAWGMCSVATQSWIAKSMIKHAMDKTCNNLDKLPVMLNDFGMRACPTIETAAVLGSGHLINFAGTDNTAAVKQIQIDYDTSEVYGSTICASAHSVMTVAGHDGEAQLVKNILTKFISGFIPGQVMALVIDSYDDEAFVKDIIFGECADLIEQIKEQGKCLVLRPDSGDPTTKVIEVLNWIEECIPDEITINTRDFKTLPPHLSTIQGDGISILTGDQTLGSLLLNLRKAEWSTDSTCFGSGGALLMGCNRDTLGFAYKLSAVKFEGDESWQGVGKETPGKASKKGRLAVVLAEDGVNHECIPEEELGDRENLLVDIYKDGLIEEAVQSFDEVQQRSESVTIYDLFEEMADV